MHFPNILKALFCGKSGGMNDKGFKGLSASLPPPPSSSPPALFILLQMNTTHSTALNCQREANKKIRKEILKFP